MSQKSKIAFMGLGIMGSGMAGRLLDGGFPLTVYNRSRERSAPLEAKGARVAGTPREAGANAEIIISMVADDAASRALWLGPDGALAGAKPGTLIIESSTVSVGWIRELGELAIKNKLEMLDAPVTGSRGAAGAGQLVFLVGGESAALQRATPALSAMGRDTMHLGALGSGALMKLINNFVCGVQLVSLAEAVAMIQRSDLDFPKALAVLTDGAPGSPLVKMIGARMAARDYTPNFLLHLMAKDLRYAIAEAGKYSLDLTTAKSALGRANEAIAAGFGDRDLSSVVELFRK
ncbi:MAG: NAD(P)-dependent oxidoreductase [Tepidisphaeraceae bacterium]|jgi:3-hydroxyisobutyrate dehydrogenase